MKEFIQDLGWFSLPIGIIALFIILLIVDCFWTKETQLSGVVMERSYTPASSSTGVGTGVSSSGNVVTTVTTTSEDEKYILLVNSGDEIYPVHTDAKRYFNTNPKDKISFFKSKGRVLGLSVGYYY